MSGTIGDNFYRASGVIAAAAAGRTGTVDWITTPKVTGDSPVTGVTGKGYFLNTTAGTITLNLPAGVAGSIVSMADYAETWQANNVTVTPNGSDKIGSINASVDLDTKGQSVTLVYVDSTQGWINTMDSTSNVRGISPYITATGGTPCSGAIVCTDYKVHTFTGPGTFCVSSGGAAAPCSGSGSNTVDYLVIAGGGAGSDGLGSNSGGAGGAGGYRESPGTASGCYSVSPRGAAPAVALSVSIQGYPIAVGGGGAISPSARSCAGDNSTFSTITSTGGGAGGAGSGSPGPGDGGDGGSGGGARGSHGTFSMGAGNTPVTDPDQGMPGGNCASGGPIGDIEGGGGGGAITAGGNGTTGPRIGGPGGPGATSSIDATPTQRAGGGGGGGGSPCATAGTGGDGGGGTGAKGTGPTPVSAATAGTANTGGGGGGGGNSALVGGAGGSGVVIIRYKFQN